MGNASVEGGRFKPPAHPPPITTSKPSVRLLNYALKLGSSAPTLNILHTKGHTKAEYKPMESTGISSAISGASKGSRTRKKCIMKNLNILKPRVSG